jgi:hypothetical protein
MFPFGSDPVGTICLLSLAAVFIWVALGRKAQLEIVINDGRITNYRGLTKAQLHRIADFLERDIALNGKVVVGGCRDSNGVQRLNFRGDVDEGTRQQIRNFLKIAL